MTQKELKQPVTKEYLGEYTEEILLPAMSRLLDDKLKPIQDNIKTLRDDVGTVKDEVKGLSAKVTNYLELSDKRYLELKNREKVLTKWIKMIADKTGVTIDLAELEKF